MPNAPYERLPTSPISGSLEAIEDANDETVTHTSDVRFERPTPPLWKRAALILFLCFLFWLSYRIPRMIPPQESAVVHASRYSREYKYRPAASPVITEVLRDGRKRLRGANPSIPRGRAL